MTAPAPSTKNLSELDFDTIFGADRQPLTWHKFWRFLNALFADISFGFSTGGAQVIDMADAAVSLVGGPFAGSGKKVVTSNVLLVDANSSGTENLTFESDCPKGLYYIVNTGGENIVVKNPAGSTVGTVATTKTGLFQFDGTNLRALSVALA